MTRTTTVDLLAEAERVRDEDVDDLEDSRQDLVDEASEEFGDPEAAPQEYHQAYQQFTDAIEQAHQRAATYEYYAEKWGGSEIVLQELTLGQSGLAIDTMAEASDSLGGGTSGSGLGPGGSAGQTPRQGVGINATLNQAVVSAPPDAPDDVTEWPSAVGQLCFDRLQEIGTPEEIDLGNSSLADAMCSSDS